jgi:hypothetical protein
VTHTPDRPLGADDDVAYRMIDAALREDPGYVLPAGFPDRVALQALKPQRRRFDWFEHLVIPLLIAPVVVYVESIAGDMLRAMLPSVSELVLRIMNAVPRLSIDGLVYAAGGMVLSAMADRLLGRRYGQRARVRSFGGR